MKRNLLLLLLLCLGVVARAQTSGIEGEVYDSKGEPLMTASVEVTEGGILKGKGITDLDGKFLLKQLCAGKYNVKVSFPNYSTEIVLDVSVVDDETTFLRIILSRLRVTGPATKFYIPEESSINVSVYVKPLREPTNRR